MQTRKWLEVLTQGFCLPHVGPGWVFERAQDAFLEAPWKKKSAERAYSWFAEATLRASRPERPWKRRMSLALELVPQGGARWTTATFGCFNMRQRGSMPAEVVLVPEHHIHVPCSLPALKLGHGSNAVGNVLQVHLLGFGKLHHEVQILDRFGYLSKLGTQIVWWKHQEWPTFSITEIWKNNPAKSITLSS